MQTRVDCPRLINQRSRTTLRNTKRNVESGGRASGTLTGFHAIRLVESKRELFRVGHVIVSTSALFSRGLQLRHESYEAAGGKLATVGFERDKNARREGPRGDRWSGEGGSNRLASVFKFKYNANRPR